MALRRMGSYVTILALELVLHAPLYMCFVRRKAGMWGILLFSVKITTYVVFVYSSLLLFKGRLFSSVLIKHETWSSIDVHCVLIQRLSLLGARASFHFIAEAGLYKFLDHVYKFSRS